MRAPIGWAAAVGLVLAACGETGGGHPYRIGDRIKVTEPPAIGSAAARTIAWGDLVPEGWSSAALPDAETLAAMDDRDPKARALYRQVREAGRNAPLNAQLDGVEVRIAGFAVPLDFRGGELLEFLLVPSFGACIHAPPPPLNQVIHVIPDGPVAKGTLSVAWVAGRLRVAPGDTAVARSGYRIEGAQVRFRAE